MLHSLIGRKLFSNFLYICVFSFSISRCEVIDRCDVASMLIDSNIDENLAYILICIASKQSGLNTSAVTQLSIMPDACKNYYGLFQIAGEWCNSEHEREAHCKRSRSCDIDCNKLLDNDITDDIQCTKIIRRDSGLSNWPTDVVNNCRMEAEENYRDITECRGRQLTAVPLWAALLMVAVACLMVFMCTYLVHRHKRRSVTILSNSEIRYFKYGNIMSKTSNGFNLQRHDQAREFTDEPYNENFEVAPSEYAIDYNICLGSGAYGVVYKATCKGKEVAVKTLKPNATKEYLQSLLGEVKILSLIDSNEYIVNLVGAHTQQIRQGILYVFMEYCPCGSLEKYLRSNRHKFVRSETSTTSGLNQTSEQFTLKNLFQYAHQIAKGMRFLEQKKIIHSDLAARNVLLVDSHTAKISDFGLSRRLYDYAEYIKTKEEPLPWRHMALESLREHSFSTQSDVWMFGVLLFEIFSLGAVPYPGISWTMDFVNKLEEGLRLNKPTHAPNDIYEKVMLQCWQNNPSERPSFHALINYFSDALYKMGLNYVEVVNPEDAFQ